MSGPGVIGIRTLATLGCVLGLLAACRRAPEPAPSVEAPDTTALEAAEHVRPLVEAARLDVLRWPAWPDHAAAVQLFYSRRGFTPAWLDHGRPSPQALGVISLLQGADSRGLAAADYDGWRWPRRVIRLQRGAPAEERAQFDVALTVSTARLATHLHRGRIDPREVGFDLDLRKRLRLPELLADLASADDPAVRLEGVEPRFSGYRLLKQALVRYLELAREGDAAVLPKPRETVRPGDRWAGVPELRSLLERLGDLPGTPVEPAAVPTSVPAAQTPAETPPAVDAAPPAPDLRYDGPLVEAVQRFQRRHGLEPDGNLGKTTLAQLAVPLHQRVLQIQLALERWRWTPSAATRPPIVVNIPEFRLRAVGDDGEVDLTMNVVVGKAFHSETPVFADLLQTVVFRPSWTVPAGITRRELVPLIERDPGYLGRERYEIVGDAGEGEVLAGLRSGKLALRQRPGRDNSLGLVKFVFPNEHNVYLHGTPATGLFARARRDLSHGCIRVADPAALAAWVLRNRPDWSAERIERAMKGRRDEVAVKVEPPIPVYIVYLTAVAGEDGEVSFFDDLYGHDARLAKALRARATSAPEAP